jgi:hypothetical protein
MWMVGIAGRACDRAGPPTSMLRVTTTGVAAREAAGVGGADAGAGAAAGLAGATGAGGTRATFCVVDAGNFVAWGSGLVGPSPPRPSFGGFEKTLIRASRRYN